MGSHGTKTVHPDVLREQAKRLEDIATELERPEGALRGIKPSAEADLARPDVVSALEICVSTWAAETRSHVNLLHDFADRLRKSAKNYVHADRFGK